MLVQYGNSSRASHVEFHVQNAAETVVFCIYVDCSCFCFAIQAMLVGQDKRTLKALVVSPIFC